MLSALNYEKKRVSSKAHRTQKMFRFKVALTYLSVHVPT